MNRCAGITNLPPGQYQFQVKAFKYWINNPMQVRIDPGMRVALDKASGNIVAIMDIAIELQSLYETTTTPSVPAEDATLADYPLRIRAGAGTRILDVLTIAHADGFTEAMHEAIRP